MSSQDSYPSKKQGAFSIHKLALLAQSAALFFHLRALLATQCPPFISAITRLLVLLNSDLPVRISNLGYRWRITSCQR
jgi:hypothetical protein